MKQKLKIGFLDSGVGGISVLAAARAKLPSADYLYYADTDHVPYGTKTREEVVSYCTAAVDYLAEQGAAAVVIACNTATSMAADILRQKYSFPIIGMEPAVKPAAMRHPHERVLVCATPLTISGEKLHVLISHLYSGEMQPTLTALPELVRYAEAGIFDSEIIVPYLAEKIPQKGQYAAVVLGCTHFPYFRDSFRQYFGDRVELIDGTEGTVNRLATLLEGKFDPEGSQGSVTYLQSGRPVVEELPFYQMLADRMTP